MRNEPSDLDRAELTDQLRRGWGIDAVALDHLPVGFGAHHWRADGGDGSRWFVTAADLRRGHIAAGGPEATFARLERAFRTAAWLHDEGGLEFVLAPVQSQQGAVMRRAAGHYALRVEPFVEGRSAAEGDFEHAGQRRQAAALVGRLHAAAADVPVDIPGREEFVLAGREQLAAALDDLDAAWNTGPFAEPARLLLRDQAVGVRERLHRYDRSCDELRRTPERWLLTHGEPHNANLLRPDDGRLLLVDWDTALVAPPERDLWMVLDDDLAGWDEYSAAGGIARLDRGALELYRERWALAEICEYVAGFRQPHDDGADAQAAWRELGEYLPAG